MCVIHQFNKKKKYSSRKHGHNINISSTSILHKIKLPRQVRLELVDLVSSSRTRFIQSLRGNERCPQSERLCQRQYIMGRHIFLPICSVMPKSKTKKTNSPFLSFSAQSLPRWKKSALKLEGMLESAFVRPTSLFSCKSFLAASVSSIFLSLNLQRSIAVNPQVTFQQQQHFTKQEHYFGTKHLDHFPRKSYDVRIPSYG